MFSFLRGGFFSFWSVFRLQEVFSVFIRSEATMLELFGKQIDYFHSSLLRLKLLQPMLLSFCYTRNVPQRWRGFRWKRQKSDNYC